MQIGTAAAALPLVHIRTAGAAGKVSMFFWDHWVPAGNDVAKKQVAAWAEKNKVDAQVDFITSNGFKNLLTINAEAQAKTGHDILTLPTWEVHNQSAQLENMDDLVGRLVKQYGEITAASTYLSKVKGHWLAMPTSWGSQDKGPCARISMMKEWAGIDVTKMYPTEEVETPEARNWTYDTFLKAAEACHKNGKPFGIGLGITADSVDTAGGIFLAYGAALVNAKGDIDVKSDKVRQVLEYAQKLVKVLPDDAVSYDDASNNRALISGSAALIMNPPSAYAVAKRDAPDVAKDCWTFPSPAGPAGRFIPQNLNFWGIWQFSPNKSAAKELVEYLMQREQVEERDNAVIGYDLPPFVSMTDFKVWSEVDPPKGTVYNYPIRKTHHAETAISGMPAPPEIAVQIYNRGTASTMFAKLKSGQSIDQVIAWASGELEGFLR